MRVAAVFGHDEDGVVGEQLHRCLHVTLLCLRAAQRLNIQNVRWGAEGVPRLLCKFKQKTPKQIQLTGLPAACVAALPGAALCLCGVAGIPEAQVTAETLQPLLFYLDFHELL